MNIVYSFLVNAKAFIHYYRKCDLFNAHLYTVLQKHNTKHKM